MISFILCYKDILAMLVVEFMWLGLLLAIVVKKGAEDDDPTNRKDNMPHNRT